MAISDTITSMYENVGNVYDVLELAGADLTNVDKNIFNIKQSWEERLLYFLANGTDVVWNNWLPKVNGTGESITLNNTIQAKMDFVYKGNTSQNGEPTPDNPIPVNVVTGDNEVKVEGKNKFNPDEFISSMSPNISVTKTTYKNEQALYVNASNSTKMTYNLSCKENTRYTFSFSVAGAGSNTTGDGYLLFEYSDGTSSTYKPINNLTENYKELVYISDANKTIVGISFQFYSVANKKYYFKNIMFSEGTTAIPYEDYTGATYPINLGSMELCKIGDYQDYIAKSTGKNLLNNNNIQDAYQTTATVLPTGFNATGGWYVSYPFNFNDGTYTINYNFESKSGTALSLTGRIRLEYDDNTYSSYYEVPYTFNTDKKIKNILFYIGQGGTISVDFTNVQLNKGSTALPYEPYGTGWYKYGAVGKALINDLSIYTYTSQIYGLYFYTKPPEFVNNASMFYNRIYKKVALTPSNWVDGTMTVDGNNIQIRDNRYSTVSDFKNGVGNEYIYYPLATPTITEITDTTLLNQLEAIKKSYNSQTNISQTNTDKPFILDVVALGESN